MGHQLNERFCYSQGKQRFLKTWWQPCDLGQARLLEWCDLMVPGTGEDEE